MLRSELISSPVPRDLGLRMAKGAAWMIALRFAVRCVGLVSMIILARLLVPADFGLVAMATVLSGALAAISEFGFQVALIQNQAADRRHYDTAWTLGLIRAFIVAGALAACAGPAAATFSDERLEPILLLLTVGVMVTSFENIAVIDFRKYLHFEREFAYRAAARIASFAITVPLTIVLRNYWALVVGIIAGQLATVILSYTMCTYRPRISLSAWREIIRFSKWLLLNNILFFAYHQVDTFVIGRFSGAQPLGFFRIANEIASLPTTEMVAPIRAALLPGYAKLASDHDRLRASFAGTFGTIVIMAVPVAVGLGLVADPLVRLALGERWLDTAPLLEVLCIAGAINVCTANTWPVFIALGRPWINATLTGLGVVLLAPLLLWSVQAAGVLGAAWALVAVSALLLAANLWATLSVLRLSGRQLLTQTWRTVVAVMIMSGAMFAVKVQWSETERILDIAFLLVSSIVIGAATYLASLWMLWRLTGLKDGPEQTVLRIVQTSLSSLSARMCRPTADPPMESPLVSGGLGGREAPAETYNRQFSEDEQFKPHYRSSIYFPLYREVCRLLKTTEHGSVLEVGCGTGAFAHCVMETLSITYRAFDFASVAIQRARERTGRDDCFFLGDARNAESYDQPYDVIVCLEVLEHIERDLDVIAQWRSGCECVCSLPNFDYQTHVRWFRKEEEIVSRYGHLISIRHIERIPCPLVHGRGLRAYLRQLRWSRENPRRLLGLLGYKAFDNFAGWFLFCGIRR